MLIALLLAAGLAACGQDEESTGDPQTIQSDGVPVTAGQLRAEYRAEADAACLEAQSEQEVRRSASGDQITLDDRARLLVDLAPVRARLAEELATLEPPPGTAGFAARARELVRAAERRAVASSAAGARRQAGEGEERIAAAAAREHDERVRFVAIARRLGLRDCGERLDKAQTASVASAIERALTSSDDTRRCAALALRYIVELYDSHRGCRKAEPLLGQATLEQTDAQGMVEVFAIARVTAHGGTAPGEHRIRVTFEDGAYKLDKLD